MFRGATLEHFRGVSIVGRRACPCDSNKIPGGQRGRHDPEIRKIVYDVGGPGKIAVNVSLIRLQECPLRG